MGDFHRDVGQAFELSVPVAGDAMPNRQLMTSRFHQEHERTYGHKADNEPVELVSVRVIAKVVMEDRYYRAKQPGADRPQKTTRCRRRAYFGPEFGARETLVLSRGDLAREPTEGPVIIEEYDSTCVVPPGCKAGVDDANNLIIMSSAER
jgi:N-methylhydantoinase A